MGEGAEQFRLNENIRKCFKTISCSLIPHPGKIVATSADYQGSLSEIDLEFLEHAKNFVEDVLSPQNLEARYIDGNVVHVKDLTNYLQSYLKVFNGNEVPNIQSITTANAEANLGIAVRNAEDYYKTQMPHVFDQDELNTLLLHEKHEVTKGKAIQQFMAAKCLDDGDKTLRKRHQTDLTNRIDKSLQQYEYKLEQESLQQHQTGYDEAIYLYDQHMKELFPLSGPYVNESQLLLYHEYAETLAIQHLSEPPKWEKDTHYAFFKEKLLHKIKLDLTEFKKANHKKWSAIYYFYPNYWLNG